MFRDLQNFSGKWSREIFYAESRSSFPGLEGKPLVLRLQRAIGLGRRAGVQVKAVHATEARAERAIEADGAKLSHGAIHKKAPRVRGLGGGLASRSTFYRQRLAPNLDPAA